MIFRGRDPRLASPARPGLGQRLSVALQSGIDGTPERSRSEATDTEQPERSRYWTHPHRPATRSAPATQHSAASSCAPTQRSKTARCSSETSSATALNAMPGTLSHTHYDVKLFPRHYTSTHQAAEHQARPLPAPQTRCSPSSKRSDYADIKTADPATCSDFPNEVGITGEVGIVRRYADVGITSTSSATCTSTAGPSQRGLVSAALQGALPGRERRAGPRAPRAGDRAARAVGAEGLPAARGRRGRPARLLRVPRVALAEAPLAPTRWSA